MSEYNWNLLETNFYFAPLEVEFSFSLQLLKCAAAAAFAAAEGML